MNRRASLMTIDILYFEGCPNHTSTLQLVREVVRDLGVSAAVREVEVKDREDASRLRFLGSPTVHVDGKDIDPTVIGRTDWSFSCRLYDRSGVPPRAMIERGIRSRIQA